MSVFTDRVSDRQMYENQQRTKGEKEKMLDKIRKLETKVKALTTILTSEQEDRQDLQYKLFDMKDRYVSLKRVVDAARKLENWMDWADEEWKTFYTELARHRREYPDER